MKKIGGLGLLMLLHFFSVKAQQNNQNRIAILKSAADLDANTLMFKADSLSKAKNFPDALTLYSKAALQYNMKKAFAKEGEAVLKMANAHYAMRNYKAAEQSILNVALKSYGKASDQRGMMNCYQSLGNIYMGLKKPVESMWFYSQQGNIATKIKDEISLTDALFSVATVKIIRKQYALARLDLESLSQRIKAKGQEAKYASLIQNMRKIISARAPIKK